MLEPGFAYVQARLQSRHGGLPGVSTWQALEASHTVGQYVALAQAGPLARWVEGLDPAADPHRTEQRLRAQWWRYVNEVAAWQPVGWQAATRWFGKLPELPLAQHPAAPWLARWLQLMPRAATVHGSVAPLQRTAMLLLPSLAGDGRGRAALPEPVRQALLRLFRRHGATPVAVFAHLALVALDLERLRGGIVTRLLFARNAAAQGV